MRRHPGRMTLERGGFTFPSSVVSKRCWCAYRVAATRSGAASAEARAQSSGLKLKAEGRKLVLHFARRWAESTRRHVSLDVRGRRLGLALLHEGARLQVEEARHA